MSTNIQKTIDFGTDFWNDSCHVQELSDAVAEGAVGATSNPVSEDELFYLQTRGIKEPAARQLLTFGFVKEAVDCLENDFLEEVILGKLERRFNKIGAK